MDTKITIVKSTKNDLSGVDSIDKLNDMQKRISESEIDIESLSSNLDVFQNDVTQSKLTNWVGLVSSGKIKDCVIDQAKLTAASFTIVQNLIRQSNKNTQLLGYLMQQLLSLAVSIHNDVHSSTLNLQELSDKYLSGLDCQGEHNDAMKEFIDITIRNACESRMQLRTIEDKQSDILQQLLQLEDFKSDIVRCQVDVENLRNLKPAVDNSPSGCHCTPNCTSKTNWYMITLVCVATTAITFVLISLFS